MSRDSSRSLALILLYAVMVLLVLGRTPLWLDEVQQFGNTRHSSLQELLRWVQVNAGASPLPYLLQRAVVSFLGYSSFAARLPAALCSIASCGVFAVLCFRFLDGGRWIGVAMFLVLPLQLRYGLEAGLWSRYRRGSLFAAFDLLWGTGSGGGSPELAVHGSRRGGRWSVFLTVVR